MRLNRWLFLPVLVEFLKYHFTGHSSQLVHNKRSCSPNPVGRVRAAWNLARNSCVLMLYSAHFNIGSVAFNLR